MDSGPCGGCLGLLPVGSDCPRKEGHLSPCYLPGSREHHSKHRYSHSRRCEMLLASPGRREHTTRSSPAPGKQHPPLLEACPHPRLPQLQRSSGACDMEVGTCQTGGNPAQRSGPLGTGLGRELLQPARLKLLPGRHPGRSGSLRVGFPECQVACDVPAFRDTLPSLPAGGSRHGWNWSVVAQAVLRLAWLPSPAARTFRGTTKTDVTAESTLSAIPGRPRKACTGTNARGD